MSCHCSLPIDHETPPSSFDASTRVSSSEHTFFLLPSKVGGDRSAQVFDWHSVLGQVFDSAG